MLLSALLVFLSLYCGKGSLLSVLPHHAVRTAGGNITMQCYHPADCSSLTWQGPAVDSSANPSRFTMNRGESVSTLVINPVVAQDEGSYSCACGSARSGPSNLIVHHLPNFFHVITNQTFHRGETAYVECAADRGDPPHDLFWFRHGNLVWSGSQIRVDDINQALVIENISDHNAGIYQCSFVLPSRVLSINISVSIVDPIQPLEDVFNSDLPRMLSVSYGDPIDLNCRSPEADPAVTFFWLPLDSGSRVDNQHLYVEPEDVVSGAYRCLAYRDSLELQRTVVVTLVDIQPIRVNPSQVRTIMSREQGELFLKEDFRFRLDRSNLSVEWKKIRNRGVADYDFGSRFTFSVSQTILRFRITDAALRDNGDYQVNVSNPYGWAELRVSIEVSRLTRTEVEIRFNNIPCNLVEEHENTIIQQIAEQHECLICGTVSVMRPVHPDCDPLHDTTTVRVTLLSQDDLPERNRISLTVGGQAVEAVVCLKACGAETTSESGVVTVEQTQKREGDSGLLVSVVVVVTVVSVVLLVLFLTIVILRTRPCRHKHRVAQEDAALEQVVVHQAAVEQPECTAYARVGSPQHLPPQSHPDVTPVTLPCPSPPPHITPLLPPLGAKPACGPKAKRPQKLYFRSHSYHGSTRTPQP